MPITQAPRVTRSAHARTARACRGLPPRHLGALFFLGLLGLAGCRGDTPEQPVAPAVAPPTIAPSTLAIPVEVPLATLSKQVEQKVPTLLKEKGFQGEPEGVRYTVKRGAIRLSAKGDTLYMKIPVSFQAEVKPKLGGGGGGAPSGPLRRRMQQGGGGGGGERGLSCSAQLELSFASRLEVTSDWTLRSKTTAGERRWSQPCEMTPLKIDVTRKVDAKLDEKVREVAGIMDERIGRAADLRAKIEHAWTTLQAPRPTGDRLWMMMNPQSIAMGPFDGDARALRSTVTVLARPTLVAAASAPTASSLPLPPNAPSTARGDGFHMQLEVLVPFTEATERAKQRLVGKAVGEGSRTVAVEDVKVSGQGDRFVIEARLAAPVSGTVTLQGRPVYDPQTLELKVEGLDFTVDTKSSLAKAADWVLHDTVKAQIAERAKVPLGPKMQEARGRIELALNRPLNDRATMQGKLDKLEAQGIYVQPDAFKLVMLANGKVAMTVR